MLFLRLPSKHYIDTRVNAVFEARHWEKRPWSFTTSSSSELNRLSKPDKTASIVHLLDFLHDLKNTAYTGWSLLLAELREKWLLFKSWDRPRIRSSWTFDNRWSWYRNEILVVLLSFRVQRQHRVWWILFIHYWFYLRCNAFPVIPLPRHRLQL